MPLLYLSPSTQEFNLYVTGGTEEEYMNRIADEMIPYLRASGITVARNTPDMTAASSIQDSNAQEVDLHLALHSNAAPEFLAGTLQGSEVYYSPASYYSRAAAQIIAAHLREIYPNPELVSTIPTTTLGEVVKVRAPGVLIEFAYHDNPEDAAWIQDNVSAIAQNVSQSVAEYFGLPFLEPQAPREGVVNIHWGKLNIREYPSTSSRILAQACDGARLTIWNTYRDWYVVGFGGVMGFAAQRYISVL